MVDFRRLVLGVGLIIVLATAWSIIAGEPYPIDWNERAPSQVLSRSGLEGLTPIVPSWKIREMTWPSTAELRSGQCEVPENLRSYCMHWMTKYLNDARIPAGLERHLVALREWETYGSKDPGRKADVFLVRFREGPRVIQIQEGLADVIIVVADERPGAQRRSDHAQFVAEVSASVLKEPLRPDLNSPRFGAWNLGKGEDGTKITRLVWSIESVRECGADGKYFISHKKALEVGTISVEAETDGRFVRFELRKHTEAAGIDAFARRFAPNPQ